MADVAVYFDNATGMGQWRLHNGDVAIADSDLLSSILLMLFTDATSSDDFVPLDGDRRGWWGNTYEKYEIGSRLWQLDRAKFSSASNILLQARDFTQEALQPFVDQGIATKITVDVAQIGPHAISITINFFKPSDAASLHASGVPIPQTFQFAYAWNQIQPVPFVPLVLGDKPPSKIGIYGETNYNDGSVYE